MKTFIKIIALLLTIWTFTNTFASYEFEDKPLATNWQATKWLRNKYFYNDWSMSWKIWDYRFWAWRQNFNLENKLLPSFLNKFSNMEENWEILVVNNNWDVLWYEYTDESKSKIIFKKYIHSSNTIKYVVNIKTKWYLWIQKPMIDENWNTSFNIIYNLENDNCNWKRLNIYVYNKKASLIESKNYNSCNNFLKNTSN